MFSRRPKFAAALLALTAMLLLQSALAFAACELAPAGAGMAASAAAAAPDCHEAGAPQAPCRAHCKGEDPAPGKIQPDLLSLPALAPGMRNLEPFAEAPAPPLPQHAFSGPPARILFQSFLL